METTKLEMLELRKKVLEYSIKITTSLCTKISLEQELLKINEQIGEIENQNHGN